MLTFTPQIQRALGDAALVPDGDIIYIVNPKWLLVLARPEEWLDLRLLEFIRKFDSKNGRLLVDWNVISAKDVDYRQQRFLPDRSRKYLPIALDTWASFPRIDMVELRSLMEGEKYLRSIYGDLINLSAMFADGQARAVYAKHGDPDKQFSKEPAAVAYQFRFDDKLVAIHGPWWRAFEELGFTLVAPREGYLGGAIPPVGLRHREGFDAVGFVHPEPASGVTEDRKGRPLFVDAATCCWTEEGHATALLLDPRHYDVKGTSLWAEASNQWGRAALRLAISALRWRGWNDDDIATTYEDGRRAAYQARQAAVFEEVEQAIRQLQNTSTSTWQLRNVETSLQRACDTIDTINRALGTSELGQLPEAVALLDEVLQGQRSERRV